MNRGRNRTGWSIFRWPLVLALASVIGLLSALLGDGWADALSWLMLGAVPATIVIGYVTG